MIFKSSGNTSGSNVLYISYDGLLEPLGKSQVIPYIIGLLEKGLKFNVMSFEKKRDTLDYASTLKLEKELKSKGINWVRLVYHKRPAVLSTIFDIFMGVITGIFLLKNNKINVIHARSYVPGIIALILRKFSRFKFIFDMRGFWADERVEAGIWKKNSLLYKAAKRLEKTLFLSCDEAISLTNKGKEEIETFDYLKNRLPRITVIPTCVDLERFVQTRHLANMFTIVYSGSVSTWILPKEMLEFFEIWAKSVSSSEFLVLTRENNSFMDVLKSVGKNNLPVSVLTVPYDVLSEYLSKASAGIAFYKPGYSRMGCSPTKVGEYLACGLPVVINAGIGDTEDIIRKERIGLIVEEFSPAEYERVSRELKLMLSNDAGLHKRCRKAAEKYFSLRQGIEAYNMVYERMLTR